MVLSLTPRESRMLLLAIRKMRFRNIESARSYDELRLTLEAGAFLSRDIERFKECEFDKFERII
jgi:hypothetical protein